MLDKQTSSFLKALYNMCDDGVYKVIDAETLLQRVGKKHSVEAMENILKYLAKNEYIDIQYSENGEYCLTVLSKGRGLFETIDNSKRMEKILRRNVWITTVLSALSAFGGALLAIFLFG